MGRVARLVEIHKYSKYKVRRSFDLFEDSRIVIGSADDCDIVVSGPMVSPHHCEVMVSWLDVIVNDLGGEFTTTICGFFGLVGTYIKSRPCVSGKPAPLWDQEELRLGGHCRFRLEVDVSRADIERLGCSPVHPLGRGGSSSVSMVRRNRDDRLLALKSFYLPSPIAHGADPILLLETTVISQFEHPGIVWHGDDFCYRSGFGEDVRKPRRGYFLQEFCPGGSINDLMARAGGPVPLATATHIIRQVLDALDYLHHVTVRVGTNSTEKANPHAYLRHLMPRAATSAAGNGDPLDHDSHYFLVRAGTTFTGKWVAVGPRLGEADPTEVTAVGLVHRDLHPSNILLMDKSKLPVAKINDFGSAILLGMPDGIIVSSAEPASADVFVGTPGFVPAAQILDYKNAGPQVDVWAAAACYYYMLTGHTPNDLDYADAWKLALIEEAVPIRERAPDIPAQLAEVIDAALVEKPHIGCQSAAELKRQIDEALPRPKSWVTLLANRLFFRS